MGLTFMQVPPHLILGAGNCISASPRSHLTSINVWRIASHRHSGPVSHQTPKIQIRVSPLSDAAHVVFHIALNVPVWGCLISIWWDEGSHQHWTHGWSEVDCIWEITSVCLVITHVCFVLRRFPVVKRDPSTNIKFISVCNIIWMSPSIYTKKSVRFKIWMEIVGQIVIKWETSSIGVFCSVNQHNLTEVPSGVINENNTRPLGDHWTVHHTSEKKVLSGGEVSSTGSSKLWVIWTISVTLSRNLSFGNNFH